MQITDIELLAPAKNKDIGIAAIDCGADALYIAGESFGAREAAGNSLKEIAELIRYANRFGVKVYLTLNTILYDNELEKAAKMAQEAFEIGCSALIIQDLGLLKLPLPPIPLIASTQTNIRDVEKAIFLESLGFSRLILPRELSLAEIKKIKSSVSAEIETFIHGSLCVSYSGQCYISENITGRSANRGCCAQICRNRFDLIDSEGSSIIKDAPLLSLKDLNLSTALSELIEAGVTSFKIEGRLKNISYVKNIVRLYRGLIDSNISEINRKNTENKFLKKSSFGALYGGFTPSPDSSFQRGYTDLFISGKRGKWNSGEESKHIGEFIGTVIGCKTSRSSTEIRVKSEKKINNGDGLCFILPNGATTGTRINTVHQDTISLFCDTRVPTGSKIYRNYNRIFEKELESNMPKRLLDTSISCTTDENYLYISATCENGSTVNITETLPTEIAQNPQKAIESIRRQFSKETGHFRFRTEAIECLNIPFYPISKLNEFRRKLAALLEERPPKAGHNNRDEQKKTYKKSVSFNNDYKLNISNRYSELTYIESGITTPEKAYEISHTEGVELMRCKYCIKFEIGICPKFQKSENRYKRYKEPLFLTNNGRRFRLKFDCAQCEMVILDK